MVRAAKSPDCLLGTPKHIVGPALGHTSTHPHPAIFAPIACHAGADSACSRTIHDRTPANICRPSPARLDGADLSLPLSRNQRSYHIATVLIESSNDFSAMRMAAIIRIMLVAIMRQEPSAHRNPEEVDPPDEAVGCRRGWRQRPNGPECVGELPSRFPMPPSRPGTGCCRRLLNPHSSDEAGFLGAFGPVL